jgi:hypothetical protein
MDDVSGEIEIHEGDDEDVTELENGTDRLLMNLQNVHDKAAECIGYGEQAYEHDTVPEQRGKDGTVEVHHHGPEAPDGNKNHIQLKRPVEAILLVLEETEYDE